MSNKNDRYGKYTYGTPKILWQTDNAKLIVGNFICTFDDEFRISEKDVRSRSEVEGRVMLYRKPNPDFDW